MHIPKLYTETHPGVIERNEYFPSSEFYKDYNEVKEYQKIIDADLGHYARMVAEKPFLEVVDKYKKILSIGGGIPKIEAAYIKANHIDVIDMKADIYKQLISYFKKTYKVNPEINYLSEVETVDYYTVRKYSELAKTPVKWSYEDRPTVSKEIQLDANIKDNEKYTYDCVSFVHFLEHLTWDTIVKLIKEQTTDIFIYMPNIEAAKDDTWFHFARFVVDHNTFFTMDAMRQLGESLGYDVSAKAYKDDMFILMKNKKNEPRN